VTISNTINIHTVCHQGRETAVDCMVPNQRTMHYKISIDYRQISLKTSIEISNKITLYTNTFKNNQYSDLLQQN